MKKLLIVFWLFAVNSIAYSQLTATIINAVQPCNNDGSLEALVSGGTTQMKQNE